MSGKNLKEILREKSDAVFNSQAERDKKVKGFISSTVERVIEELTYSDSLYFESIIVDDLLDARLCVLKMNPPSDMVLNSHYISVYQYMNSLSEALRIELIRLDIITDDEGRLKIYQDADGKITIRFAMVFKKEKETEEDV